MLGYASQITKADLERYIDLIVKGKEQSAVDLIMSKYIKPVTTKFDKDIVTGISRTDGIVLSPRGMAKISLNVRTVSVQAEKALDGVFSDFVRKVVSPITFGRLGITSTKAKEIILQHSIETFKERTAGALSNTQADILRNIRNYQKDLAVRFFAVDRKADLGIIAKAEVERFKKQMREEARKLNPKYVQMLEDGKLIASRTSINGKVMHYSLEQYAEMSIRNALLNIDRIAAETAARVNGDAVVQIYLRDHRKVKTEREICQHVIAHGGLLAMSEEIAGVLGIPSLDEYRSLDGMGINCRHSIRAIDAETSESINKVLFLKGLVDGEGNIIEPVKKK